MFQHPLMNVVLECQLNHYFIFHLLYVIMYVIKK